MRRLLLILPALQQATDRGVRHIKYARFPPLSLLTIAGLTPDETWEITVRDEHVESVELDEHFDLVGIQVCISAAYRAYVLSRYYQARGAQVVLGGLHPSSLPDEAQKRCDAVVVGPAESVWAEVLEDHINGCLKRRYIGKPKGSAAKVPLPRRDLMNPSAYLIRNTIVTSRGCPLNCDYCYKTSFWGANFHEGRPYAHLAAEIDQVDDGLVFFLDDNLLASRRHGRAVCEIMKGRGIVWQCAASIDVARDPAYLKAAYEAGCRSLFIGFESLSSENMRASNKALNARTDYADAIKRIHDAGLMINSSFVFGFDEDGPDVFDRTVEWGIEHKLETATFHVLTPFPGTVEFDRMAAQGRILHRNWSYYDTDHAVFRPKRMTPQQLEAGHKRAYRDFNRYGAIWARSRGLPKPLKRIAYNIGWMKVDPLWSLVGRTGTMPLAGQVLRRVLAIESAHEAREQPAPSQAPTPKAEPAPELVQIGG